MGANALETIEIVKKNIINSNVEVGSGCIWRGRGKEPDWDNAESKKAYDHIARHHGHKLKPSHFKGRCASTNKDQGQWFNPQDWIIAEQFIPKYEGNYIIKFNRPIGRVYHPDGRTTESVDHVMIGRKYDGTIKYAYPIVKL